MIYNIIIVHLSGVYSPVKTSATGFPLCSVETQGLHPRPSGTVNVHMKDKPLCYIQHSITIRKQLKLSNKYTYLTNSLYIEVLPFAIKEFLVLLNHKSNSI